MRSPTTSAPGRASAARTGRTRRWAAVPPRCGSPRSRWEAPVPDLGDLVRAAVEAAGDGEAVEAYAQESRQTEASALRGEVEGLTFAESRGLGVRLIRDGRLGYAFAADPTEVTALPELFDAASAEVPTADKVQMALDLESRLVSSDPRVTKIDMAQVGDAVTRVAIASTAGVDAEYARTDAWCVAVALAVEGD